MGTPKDPKKDTELTDEELEGATGGAGTADTATPTVVEAPKEAPKISIVKIPSQIGPTAPHFDPGKVMHSPNNAT